MKTYDEMARAVLRRIDAYETAKARKKRTVTRAATGLGCVGLAAFLGVGAWHSGLFPQGGSAPVQEFPQTDTFVSSLPDATVTTVVPTAPTQDTDDKLLFDVNEITQIVPGAKRKLPEGAYEEAWDTARMSRHLGVDLQGLGESLYDELKVETIHSHSVTLAEDGTMLYDLARIRFIGAQEQSITVKASKLSTPYDCMYQLESERETRIRLGNTDEYLSVLVAAQTDADGTITLCVADFEYAGVNFRIEMENVPLISLDRLIREIAE